MLSTPPSVMVHGRIFWRIYDQVYRRDDHAGKIGETRAAGAVLADGEKITFDRRGFVDVLDVPLPCAPKVVLHAARARPGLRQSAISGAYSGPVSVL